MNAQQDKLEDTEEEQDDGQRSNYELDRACSEIHIDKSSQNSEEIKENMARYDLKNYRGIQEFEEHKKDLARLQKEDQYLQDQLYDSQARKMGNLISERRQQKQVNFKNWIQEGEELCK